VIVAGAYSSDNAIAVGPVANELQVPIISWCGTERYSGDYCFQLGNGDCGGDGMVTINDLILGVNIALGNLPADDCPAFQNAQGNVDIAQGFFAEYRGHLDAGKVAPLAVASTERMPYLKDMPTFNEALGGKDYIWAVIRFVAVPKGTPPDRKAYLAAGVKAAMNDPELVAEYRKAGVYFDPALVNSTAIANDLNGYAERERAFYQQTGRLK